MPRIREVKLRNFKTFGSKATVIRLDDGFTALTGPNGSGKSNIVDAILFGLGELSAKRLRVDRFSSLIRNGARKAEVSIQFDNSDHAIPVDSDVVTISRELDLSGQSVFRLNGKRIQRSDLLNLLSVAGIGPSGSNVVTQGSITRLATLSPTERREIIDEIVGIAQYDAQKRGAEEKLRRAEAALRDVMGRMEEIRLRLEELERERKRLQRYRFLESEIKRLRAIQISHAVRELRETISVLKSRLEALEGRLSELRAARDELRGEHLRVEREWELVGEDVVKSGGAQLPKIRAEIEGLRSELGKLNFMVNSKLSTIDEYTRERGECLKQMTATQKEMESVKAEISKLIITRGDLSAKIGEKEREIGELNAKIRSLMDKQRKGVDEALKLSTHLDELYRRLLSAHLFHMHYRGLGRHLKAWMKDAQRRRERLERASKLLRRILREPPSVLHGGLSGSKKEQLLRAIRIVDGELREAQLKLQTLKQLTISSEKNAEAWKAKIRSTWESLDETRRQLEELREALDPSNLANLESRREELQRELEEMRGELGSVETKIATLRSKLDKILEPRLKELKTRTEGLERKINELRREVESHLEKKREFEENLKRMEELAEQLSLRISEAQERRDSLSQKLKDVRERLNTLEKEYEETSRKLGELQLELRTRQMELKSHLSTLRELGYEEPLEISEEEIKGVNERLKTLELEFRNLGAVNQLAEAQYKEQASRYKEFLDRVSELEKDRDAILEFMEEIERRKREEFMNAFRALNEKFSAFFSKLTGGGRAYLELENPEDPFSGGLDIMVQFPNKAVIPVSGASGGERSVTAVAFLLALQQFSPSSFYILDEIDAHLDAYYVDKLGELLVEESKKSQFVVISLKPELVRRAGKIYGLYYQRGMSHLVPMTPEGEMAVD